MRRDGETRKTSRVVRQRARELRREQTPAERQLWRVLRDRSVNGLKFRRQHPLDGFVLDFFCPDARLCVELDSWKHHGSRDAFVRDRARDRCLMRLGWRVLRYTWHDLEALYEDLHREV